MRKLLLCWLVVFAGLAQAQVVRSFATVFNSNTTGNIVTIGNTLMTCGTSTVTPSSSPNCNTNDTTWTTNLNTNPSSLWNKRLRQCHQSM